MRAVIQRATSGEVLVDGEVVGRLALPADSAGSAGDEAGAGSAAQVSSRGVGAPGDVGATTGEATPVWEGSIGARQGLVVLLGVQRGDGPTQVTTVARKIAELRILDDERSALDVHAPILVISQFTLYGDTRKGRRPSWAHAAPRGRSRTLGRRGCGRSARPGPARRDRPVRRDDGGLAGQRRAFHGPRGGLASGGRRAFRGCTCFSVR